MRVFLALVRRELSSFFFSWTGYVVIAAVLFLLGFSLNSMLRALNTDSTPMPIMQLFYSTSYFWSIIIIASPVITMRSFAQEKSTGTYETLMTTPVSELLVVMAKFAGALIFFMIMWLPLLGCLVIIRHYTSDPTAFDWGGVGSTFFGIFLVGCLFLSMGICASAMTRSQIIAAILTLAIGCLFIGVSQLRFAFTVDTGWIPSVIAYVSMAEHMRDFAQGVVDTRPLVFYVTSTAFFVFLTLKMVESRRWK